MTQQRTESARAAEMRPLVEEWRQGSASQAEVARRHGLNPGTFSWWCARLGGRAGKRRGPASPRLVPVKVVDAPRSAGARRFDVVLSQGLRVRVPSGFEATELRRLVEALRSC